MDFKLYRLLLFFIEKLSFNKYPQEMFSRLFSRIVAQRKRWAQVSQLVKKEKERKTWQNFLGFCQKFFVFFEK